MPPRDRTARRPNRSARPNPKAARPLRAVDSPRPPRRSPAPAKPLRIPPLLQSVLRLLVLGVGLGVLAGSLIAAWEPNLKLAPTPQAASAAAPIPVAPVKPIAFQEPLAPLQTQLAALIQQQPALKAELFLTDLDTGNYVDINGTTSIPAASTIKIPVLAALMEAVQQGKVRLDEQLTMTQDLVASEAGAMQYQPVGSKFTVLETAIEMIRISDNTATNLLIARLGGIEAVNQRFAAWGLQTTRIRNLLPDLEGTNSTTPKEMVELLAKVENGSLLDPRSRDRFFAVLRTTETNTLLSRGLGEEATIAHKTGDIAMVVGDVGLIDMPSGKRYIAAMLVRRPDNDLKANELIRQVSQRTYQFLNSLPVSSNSTQQPS
ncbi:serine hydrolase [Synechococcus elongatus]|uniref:Beta-lactamase n=1 Tax=Synechococcus elongatus (strain ATCC 33912 / PCC 7942 / FACHB-805) TaxID=1140 RepID=Q31MT6_SYNE7|nr:serine hydrolase [Synechococcus elongatus]ABB57633.1 beta-lactamase [Synechococcus elongatus PCC 7942 = FACHB-805]AJD57974.1 beta-lactamase [Synechococcus elongatus UTEX 2973]MBD2588441.1 serine hydrolase [Synechococcus elongatus FACHB-242]MBD2689396.1 serine hydrolase [Synechococcus elongatus FACHB-1061]MBD2708185.1 serine hydrolase [Synechococcus elongatus PCC 7942 = FACHB-805]